MSSWFRRPYGVLILFALSSSGTLVVPFARPPGGRRPRSCCTIVFGTFQFAALGFTVGWMPAKIVGLFVPNTTDGCERSVALTCTPILGTVYDARPRTVVSPGSTRRQLRGSGLSTSTIEVHASLMPRPVVVPN